jgi:hypothetical protein
MELFPFRPNWKTPLIERLEWLTDVIEAHDSTEDRTPLRSMPRRSLEYRLTLNGHPAARLDALLWRWQAGQYVLPIWTDPQHLAAELSMGASTIPAVTAGYDFSGPGQAVLWAGDAAHEIVQVQSVGASSLTLSVPTASAWPAGTRLYPARLARLDEKVASPRITGTVAQATVRWEIDPALITPIAGTTTYRSIEVFERRPNWIAELPLEYHRKVRRLDYALGAVEVDDHAGIPITLRDYRTLLRDRADIAAWRGWLSARQGRYAPVWAHSRTLDLEQTTAMGPTDVALTVRALDAENRYRLDTGRQDIALYHRPTAQWFYRRIDAIAAGGTGEEILTLDSALGVTAAVGDLSPISWLTLSRLEADAAEIAWHTPAVAESTLQLRSVRS